MRSSNHHIRVNSDLKPAAPNKQLRRLRKLLTAPLVIIAAVVIIIEDWLWDDLARLAAYIGRLPVLRAIETFISSLPPYLALLCFATPSLLLIPLKLISIYFLAHGKAWLSLLTLVIAKFAGTALVARIFTLTRPALMQIHWFALLYTWFIAFKTRIYAVIKATAIYRAAHRLHLELREALRHWLGRRGVWRKRWHAARRSFRRRKLSQP